MSMKINTIADFIRKYLFSAFYPATLGLFAFLCWLMPGNWVYFPAVFYALFSFLPLLAKTGKCYLPIYLFQIILPSSPLLLSGIPREVLLTGICSIVSSALFLILNRPKLKKGEIFYPFLIFITTLLISYLYNMIRDGSNDFQGILYILALYGLLLLSMFFFTTLGQEEILPYLSTSIAIFDILITTQILVNAFYDNSTTPFVWSSFTLGWAMNGSTACSLLCLSLPFLAMNIAKKRLQSLPVFLYSVLGILLVSSYSSLIVLLFSLVPLIFLSFSSYQNKYPYLVLISLVLSGTVLTFLIGFSKTANENILNALRSLNPLSDLPKGRLDSYQTAIEEFINSPIFGVSIAGRTTSGGSISFVGNNVLSSLVLGGSITLLAFLFLEGYTYYITLKKKTPERYLFLIFLLANEMLGYMDDTLYLIPILLFYLLCVTVYQMSNRPQDVMVHQSYFENYRPENILDKR